MVMVMVVADRQSPILKVQFVWIPIRFFDRVVVVDADDDDDVFPWSDIAIVATFND